MKEIFSGLIFQADVTLLLFLLAESVLERLRQRTPVLTVLASQTAVDLLDLSNHTLNTGFVTSRYDLARAFVKRVNPAKYEFL